MTWAMKEITLFLFPSVLSKSLHCWQSNKDEVKFATSCTNVWLLSFFGISWSRVCSLYLWRRYFFSVLRSVFMNTSRRTNLPGRISIVAFLYVLLWFWSCSSGIVRFGCSGRLLLSCHLFVNIDVSPRFFRGYSSEMGLYKSVSPFLVWFRDVVSSLLGDHFSGCVFIPRLRPFREFHVDLVEWQNLSVLCTSFSELNWPQFSVISGVLPILLGMWTSQRRCLKVRMSDLFRIDSSWLVYFGDSSMVPRSMALERSSSNLSSIISSEWYSSSGSKLSSCFNQWESDDLGVSA